MMMVKWNEPVPPGYRKAANVIVEYDAGNHTFYGRLLSCDTCGSAVLETAFVVHDSWHAGILSKTGDVDVH